MTTTLSRQQLRAAQRLVARLRAKPKGTLIIAVGQSTDRRAAFEAALADAGIEVATGTIDDSRGPWTQIAQIAGKHATASISWIGDDEAQRRISQALNLGREAIHELPAGLLLWIGGLRSIESFPSTAPDLWAYRGAVIWVLSAEDFEPEPSVRLDPELTLAAQLRKHEEALAQLAPDDIDRLWELFNYSARLEDARQLEAAHRALAEVERCWSVMPQSERAWNADLEEMLFCARVDRAISLLRDQAAWAIVAEVDWRTSTGTQTNGVAAFAARFTAVLASRWGNDGLAEEAHRAAAQYTRWSALNRASVQLDFCAFLVADVGDITRAIDSCQIETTEAEGGYLDWLLTQELMKSRAQIAKLQLRYFDATMDFHRAWRSCLEHGDLRRGEQMLFNVAAAYQAIGLARDTLPWFGDTLDAAVARASTSIALGQEAAARAALHWVCDECSSAGGDLYQVVEDFQRLEEVYFVLDDTLDRRALADVRARAISCLDSLIDRARRHHQTRAVQHANGWRIRLLLDLDRLDEAEVHLVELITISEQSEGPRLRAKRYLERARLALARRNPTLAQADVDRAERTLLEERDALQSRYVWRELLEMRAEVLAAQSKFEQARTTLAAARDRMHAAALERETLRVCHRLAEPLPGEPSTPAALADRDRAAFEALRISSAASLVYEEARALANVAVIHAERGQAEPAHTMIAEAIWLSEGHVGLRAHLERCEALIRTLVSPAN